MYANLRVEVRDKRWVDEQETAEPQVFYCWEVTMAESTVVLRIDDQDGQGSTVVPAGELQVDLATHDVTVMADF